MLRRCHFTDNLATTSGGAVTSNGEAHILSSSFIGNQARTGDGGGVQIGSGGFLRTVNSTFDMNFAPLGRGGGVCVVTGNLVMTHCTFNGNSSAAATTRASQTLLQAVWAGEETAHASAGGGLYLSDSRSDYQYTAVDVAKPRDRIVSGSGSSLTDCSFSGLKSFTGGGMYAYVGCVARGSTLTPPRTRAQVSGASQCRTVKHHCARQRCWLRRCWHLRRAIHAGHDYYCCCQQHSWIQRRRNGSDSKHRRSEVSGCCPQHGTQWRRVVCV